MDCLQELAVIELSFDGTLAEMGTLLATVPDPVEQMVLAVFSVQKYREHHEMEAANFSEMETLWRVATEVRKVKLDQQETCLIEIATHYGDALREYQAHDRRSDKKDSINKNKDLQLQIPGQLELCLTW